MYVSYWVPPEAQEAADAKRDGGARRRLLAFAVVLSIAVATILACGYAGHRLDCAALATAEPC